MKGEEVSPPDSSSERPVAGWVNCGVCGRFVDPVEFDSHVDHHLNDKNDQFFVEAAQ